MSVRRLAVGVSLGGLLAGLLAGATIDSRDFSAADLFRIDKVWTADFVFTPEQWKAITPHNNGGRGFSIGGGRELGPEGGRNGFAAAGGVVFDWTHANFSIDGRSFNNVAVRYKGNGTYFGGASAGKISLKVDLNKYVKGQKLAKLDRLNFANKYYGSRLDERGTLLPEVSQPGPLTILSASTQ